MDAIAACLQNQEDSRKVELILLDGDNRGQNISTLTNVFDRGGPELYEPFLKILDCSPVASPPPPSPPTPPLVPRW